MHETQFKEFLAKLSLQNEPESSLLSKLHSLPTSDIKSASDAIWTKYDPSVRWPFQPTIDGPSPGAFITQPPISSWKAGKFHRVPILTGYNTNEGAMFTPPGISTPLAFTSFFRTLLPGLSETDLTTLEDLYPDPSTDSSSIYRETRRGLGAQFKRTEQAYGHFAYVAPVKQTARFAANAENAAPVYLYHFAAESSARGGERIMGRMRHS